MTVAEALAQYEAALVAHQTALNAWPKQAEYDALLDVCEAMAKERQEYAAPFAATVTDRERELKALVLESGASVKGNVVQAVFTKGRVSWDTRALDGYAAGHPEVAQFRKQGEPSVSIRPL